MGDLTDQASGCFKIILIVIAAMIISIYALFYSCGENSGNNKGYQQGVRDAMSGQVDTLKFKK